jgi:hypothetical protein
MLSVRCFVVMTHVPVQENQLCKSINEKQKFDKYNNQGCYARKRESTRTLYQWLPLIIACQALFFRLPDIILRVSDSLLGYGSSKVVGLVRGYKNLRSIDRTALAREMANYYVNRRNIEIPVGKMVTDLYWSNSC